VISILNDTGVALLPGSDFGFDQKQMLARLSFTDFDGQKFMNEIKDDERQLILIKLCS
jgi:aspartate aminotransferase